MDPKDVQTFEGRRNKKKTRVFMKVGEGGV